MPRAAAPDEVNAQGDDDQAEEDAETGATEPEAQGVGGHEGVSDVSHKGYADTSAERLRQHRCRARHRVLRR
jgi:hypothetical protein